MNASEIAECLRVPGEDVEEHERPTGLIDVVERLRAQGDCEITIAGLLLHAAASVALRAGLSGEQFLVLSARYWGVARQLGAAGDRQGATQ